MYRFRMRSINILPLWNIYEFENFALLLSKMDNFSNVINLNVNLLKAPLYVESSCCSFVVIIYLIFSHIPLYN